MSNKSPSIPPTNSFNSLSSITSGETSPTPSSGRYNIGDGGEHFLSPSPHSKEFESIRSRNSGTSFCSIENNNLDEGNQKTEIVSTHNSVSSPSSQLKYSVQVSAVNMLHEVRPDIFEALLDQKNSQKLPQFVEGNKTISLIIPPKPGSDSSCYVALRSFPEFREGVGMLSNMVWNCKNHAKALQLGDGIAITATIENGQENIQNSYSATYSFEAPGKLFGKYKDDIAVEVEKQYLNTGGVHLSIKQKGVSNYLKNFQENFTFVSNKDGLTIAICEFAVDPNGSIATGVYSAIKQRFASESYKAEENSHPIAHPKEYTAASILDNITELVS